MILNKGVRADSNCIGVCEAAGETSGYWVTGAPSVPTLSALMGMSAEGI